MVATRTSAQASTVLVVTPVLHDICGPIGSQARQRFPAWRTSCMADDTHAGDTLEAPGKYLGGYLRAGILDGVHVSSHAGERGRIGNVEQACISDCASGRGDHEVADRSETVWLGGKWRIAGEKYVHIVPELQVAR